MAIFSGLHHVRKTHRQSFIRASGQAREAAFGPLPRAEHLDLQ